MSDNDYKTPAHDPEREPNTARPGLLASEICPQLEYAGHCDHCDEEKREKREKRA